MYPSFSPKLMFTTLNFCYVQSFTKYTLHFIIIIYKSQIHKQHLKWTKKENGNISHNLQTRTKTMFSFSYEGPTPSPPTDSDSANQGTEDDANKDGKECNQPLPEFGQYLYFLFCPTLIYRDQYPM